MKRRDFLKNSIGALLFCSIAGNKILTETTVDSPKVLLYLIKTIKGDWKIRATKWVDLPKKRLIPSEVVQDTFKPLEVVDLNKVNERRLLLWKEHNCTGRMGHLVSMNLPMTPEMKKEYQQLGELHKGIKLSIETRKKISKAAIGRPSPLKGKKYSEQEKKNMSESAKKRVYTDEGRKKRSIKMTLNNPFRGKKHTEESRKKILDKHPSKIKVTCEHCNKTLDYPNYKRYHSDKCKLKVS